MLAGADFNIQPSEGSYRLLTGAALSAEQEDALALSSVVHRSWDEHRAHLAASGSTEDADDQDIKEDDDNEPSSSSAPAAEGGEIYAQPEGDEDRVLKNTRPARPEDGLLSLSELKSMYKTYGKGSWSVYGRNYGRIEAESGNWFGEREGKPAGPPDSDAREQEQRLTPGYYEPAWTNGKFFSPDETRAAG